MQVWAAALSLLFGLTGTAAQAQALCEGRADALGTARVLAVDAATTPRVGRKSFPQTLPLAPHEVVLTFDDGPWPGTTPRVLDALKAECVRATFFIWDATRSTIRKSPVAKLPRGIPSRPTLIRILCLTGCHSPLPSRR